jgi:hypothetical protein
MATYEQFLEAKAFIDKPSGFDAAGFPLGSGGTLSLFPFQDILVRWALKRGRAAIFADTGMGKTAMQSAWAYAVHQYTGNRVLILAPLCVAPQTVEEAAKFGVHMTYVREMPEEGSTGIFITNYEMLEHFEPWIAKGYFDGIVLDESSILKSNDSKTRARIIQVCKSIPYKLSCTATPSPNDYVELGNQSEFLGVMSSPCFLLMTQVKHQNGDSRVMARPGFGSGCPCGLSVSESPLILVSLTKGIFSLVSRLMKSSLKPGPRLRLKVSPKGILRDEKRLTLELRRRPGSPTSQMNPYWCGAISMTSPKN